MGVGKFPGSGVARHAWTEALGGFGCIHGAHFTEPYPRHVHARFVAAVIESGTLRLRTPRGVFEARPGAAVLINSFRVHGEWWSDASFRAVYLSRQNLQECDSILSGPMDEPMFAVPVVNDPILGRCIRELHDAVQSASTVTAVEAQTVHLLRFLADLSSRVSREALPHPMGAVRDRLHADLAAAPSTAELSRIAVRSPFHLIRTFHRLVGLPPHAYYDQVRVAEAKEYLTRGRSLSDTAYALGYCDQSHFTRGFKRSALVTPGQYVAMVRGNAPA